LYVPQQHAERLLTRRSKVRRASQQSRARFAAPRRGEVRGGSRWEVGNARASARVTGGRVLCRYATILSRSAAGEFA